MFNDDSPGAEKLTTRNGDLKILDTDIPQLATSVELRRLENLTGYPLARMCEWAPARRKQYTHETGDNSSEDLLDLNTGELLN